MKTDKAVSCASLLADAKPAKAITRLAVPATLALLAKAVYNIVDTAYIGMLDSDIALAAVGVTLPLLLIMVSVENIFAAGASVLAGRQLGAGDKDGANRTVTTIVGLSMAIGLGLCILGIPVSYTHLDVYKRQLLLCQFKGGIVGRVALHIHIVDPGLVFCNIDLHRALGGAVTGLIHCHEGETVFPLLARIGLIGVKNAVCMHCTFFRRLGHLDMDGADIPRPDPQVAADGTILKGLGSPILRHGLLGLGVDKVQVDMHRFAFPALGHKGELGAAELPLRDEA